jgi:hypothetical protein
MTKPKVEPEAEPKVKPEYVYEAREYWKLVESAMHLWSAGEFGEARQLEDQLIERFVRDAEWQYEDPRAAALVELFNHEARRKR